MEQVRIVTDSTADIPDDLVEALGIGVVYGYINFGGQSYRDKVEISRAEFYRRLATEADLPTTAAPGIGEFEAAFRQAGAPEHPVVSLHLPARFSVLCNAARMAAQAFPQGRVTVLDTGQLSMGLGWLVIMAARAAREGAQVAEIVQLVETLRKRVRLYAALDSFEFLRRSGRVGWARAIVGTLLHIKPVIELRAGQALPLDRVRTTRRAINRLVELVSHPPPISLSILHTDWPQGAAILRERLAHLSLQEPILTVDVTPVIGVHVGPKGLGVAAIIATD